MSPITDTADIKWREVMSVRKISVASAAAIALTGAAMSPSQRAPLPTSIATIKSMLPSELTEVPMATAAVTATPAAMPMTATLMTADMAMAPIMFTADIMFARTASTTTVGERV